jgi:hypothetical protein
MTASLRGRVAIATLVAVVVFAAAFAVRRASAGTTKSPSQPATLSLPATQVHVTGVALPAASVPALRRPPHVVTNTPSTTPATTTPATTTPAPSTPAPSTPSTPAPSKSSSPSSGPVLVG